MDKKKLFLICLFTGFIGGHYYAIGKFKRGLLYTFTAGLFFIGWVTDLIRISTSEDFIQKVEKIDQKKREQNSIQRMRMQARREKLNDLRQEGVPYCPRCHSTSLTANKKGFSLGKGLVGSAIVLPLGVVTGMIGKNKIYITCLNCGHRFKPGSKF